MKNFTFLTKEQIFGDKKLEIIKKYGAKASITDYSILRGGYVSNEMNYDFDSVDRTGLWWTKTEDNRGGVYAIGETGNIYSEYVFNRIICGRPVLYFDLPCDHSSLNQGDVREILVSECPQTIENEDLSDELEYVYRLGKMKATGTRYSYDSTNFGDFSSSISLSYDDEYSYKGKKYVRRIGDYNCNGEVLSDGRVIEINRPYWVKVEPISWLIERINDKQVIVIPKKLVYAGIRFNEIKYYEGNFEETEMKEYLDQVLSKEINFDVRTLTLKSQN